MEVVLCFLLKEVPKSQVLRICEIKIRLGNGRAARKQESRSGKDILLLSSRLLPLDPQSPYGMSSEGLNVCSTKIEWQKQIPNH
jgi:hypothetical protein